MRRKLLLIEDDQLFRQTMVDFLSDRYDVLSDRSAEEALRRLSEITPDMILLDASLPGMSGKEVLAKIAENWSHLPVVMLTAIDRIPFVVECIKLGAFDYLTKPVIPEALLLSIDRAIESADMKQELQQRRKIQLVTNKEYRLMGSSPALDFIRKQIDTIAPFDSPVLIEGNTGTGKELIARSIHSASNRASRPFVALNCGAIPRELVESEFFGYKKGAFTGAHAGEIGKFALANHGTLLLDEISELPLDSQTKLLRVLEENEFYPVGSTQLMKVDVRIIATTNRNLSKMVEERVFRQDLFFRLNIYSIIVPPLTERKEDIVPLAEYFMHRFNAKFGKHFRRINESAAAALEDHSWPGNIRELRNIMERVVLSEDGNELEKEHLRFLDFGKSDSSGIIKIPENGIDLEELEKSLILQAFKIAKGNKTKAAKLLNLTSPTLYYRLEKYGIKHDS